MFQEDAPQTQPTQPVQQPQPSAQPAQPQPPKPPVVTEKPIQTTQEERMWAAIGYIAFLGFVTLAIKSKSEFCRKHASQGLVLFLLWFVGLILLAVNSFISLIGGLLMLAITVLVVLGIVKAISSYEFNFPVLTSLAKMVPVDAIVGSMTGKTPETTTTEVPTQPQTPEQTEQPSEPNKPEEQNPQQ